MPKPLRITLITATFNSATTVSDCLRSIRAQTYPHIESLIIDGGSLDGTVELIQSNFADVVTHMRSEPDNGIYDALNKGLHAATGDVIGLLHSDDELADPEVLSSVAEAFADPRVDAVYGDLIYVRRDEPDKVVRLWRSCPFQARLLRRGWMPPHPTLYLRRRMIGKAGDFDTSYAIAADYDHVLRVFTQPNLVSRHLPRVLVRMKTGGTSNRSLANLFRKSREDLQAIQKNGIGGLDTLLLKNFSKLGQFGISSKRHPESKPEGNSV